MQKKIITFLLVLCLSIVNGNTMYGGGNERQETSG